MKKLNTLGIIAGATLLCAAPVSLHWSPVTALGLSLNTAQARVMNKRAVYGYAAHPHHDTNYWNRKRGINQQY
jgi:hypothetical protein